MQKKEKKKKVIWWRFTRNPTFWKIGSSWGPFTLQIYPKLFLWKSSTRESNEIMGLETFFFFIQMEKIVHESEWATVIFSDRIHIDVAMTLDYVIFVSIFAIHELISVTVNRAFSGIQYFFLAGSSDAINIQLKCSWHHSRSPFAIQVDRTYIFFFLSFYQYVSAI